MPLPPLLLLLLLGATAAYATGAWEWVGGNRHLQNSSLARPGGRCCGHSWWLGNSTTLWIFGGSGYSGRTGAADYLADLWSYDATHNTWALHGDGVGVSVSEWPAARYYGTYWPDRSGHMWLWSGFGAGGTLDDMWRLVPPGSAIDLLVNRPAQWQQVHPVGRRPAARCWAHSWALGETVYVFSGTGADGGMLSDLWAFSSHSLVWSQLADYDSTSPVYSGPTARPGARENGYAMADERQQILWLYGGNGYGADSFGGLDDLWSLAAPTDATTPLSPAPPLRWEFRGGTNQTFSPWDQSPPQLIGKGRGVHGQRGVATAQNVPSAAHAGYMWPHSAGGRLWIMGGEDDQANTNGHGIYSGLWSLEPASAEWAWEAGN